MAPPRRKDGPTTPPFPTKQLVILAICRFSEPIAFNSILAYMYVMVRDLNGGEDRNTAFYAGLLVSAYAVAEALTAVGWGALSDKYGRKPVVLFGLVGVAISCLIFGLAEKYWVALLARFIGGALNGNVAVMQTMVAEMVKVPEHEPVAYASQPFVWMLGGIVGSAMGGFLAQPAIFYPDLFPASGLFGRYPYLLPNLVSVVVIVVVVIQGILFLEETNPRGRWYRKRTRPPLDKDDPIHGVDERTPLTRGGPAGDDAQPKGITAIIGEFPVIPEEALPTGVTTRRIRSTHHTTTEDRDEEDREEGEEEEGEEEEEEEEEYTGPALNFTIVMLTISLVLVSYHQMAFATLLPTHLLDRPRAPRGQLDLIGGLGYTIHDVGIYLSVHGFIGLFIQGVIFPLFVDRVGVWRSFFAMVLLYPLSYVVSPFLSALPTAALQSAGIYLAMVLQSLFGIVVIPTALILLKNATPSTTVLGRVNGLAMAGCCLARTLSPPLVGIVYEAAGSAAAWLSCAVVAVLGILQLFWVPREHVF